MDTPTISMGICPLCTDDDVDVEDEVQALEVVRRIREDVKATIHDAIQSGALTDRADNLARQSVSATWQAADFLYARLILSASEEARARVPEADRTYAERMIRRDPLLLLVAAREGWSPIQLSVEEMKALLDTVISRGGGGAAFAEDAWPDPTSWN